MNALELINIGNTKLKLKNILSSRIDSEILLAQVLGKNREQILLNLNEKVEFKKIKRFKELIRRRERKEPIAYILKEKEFWSKKFEVNNGTLIPRPETELMVEKLLNVNNKKKLSILDIGTGSGCILISLLSELKDSRGIGIDISKKALETAKRNAVRHNLKGNLKFFKRSFLEIYSQKFDLVVSNPPYIKTRVIRNLESDVSEFEPFNALDGGNDGLDVIKKVIYKSREILKIKGLLALEIGNEQNKEVSKILKKNSFRIKYTVKDYKDNVRCLISSREN